MLMLFAGQYLTIDREIEFENKAPDQALQEAAEVCEGVRMVGADNLKSKNRILVVDDESDITLTFEWILRGEGFDLNNQ